MATLAPGSEPLFLELREFKNCSKFWVDYLDESGAWSKSVELALEGGLYREQIPFSHGTIVISMQVHTADVDLGDGHISIWSEERHAYVLRFGNGDANTQNTDELKDLFRGHSVWAPHPTSSPWSHYHAVFFKWSQLRSQETDVQYIEAKASSDTPFEPVIIGGHDPKLHRKDHRRYSRGVNLFRNYRPIDNVHEEDVTTQHAADASLAMVQKTHDELSIVLMIYDTERYYEVSHYKHGWVEDIAKYPCFKEDINHRTFLTDLFKADKDYIDLSCIFHYLCRRVTDRMIAEQRAVLHEISQSMDKIELALADDRSLRAYQPRWRRKILQWKNHLYHIRAHFEQTQTQGQGYCNRRFGSCAFYRVLFQDDLKEISDAANVMLQRLESLYQTMMTTMNIIESDRAISEAEQVAKLTSLAFFFIPLSFAASVFGMNIVEFGDIKAWIWAVTSAVILLTTYTLLYRREIGQILSRLPQYLDFSWQVVKQLMYILWPFQYLISMTYTNAPDIPMRLQRDRPLADPANRSNV